MNYKRQLRDLLNEKRRDRNEIYKITKKFLKKEGELFLNGKEAYFYHREKKELFCILQKPFKQYLATELHFDRGDQLFTRVINHLEDVAYRGKNQISFHKFAFYDEKVGKLYVNQFGGSMYVLDGKKSEMMPVGVDGVFFNDPEYCEPYEYVESKGDLANKYLFRKKNFNEKGNVLSAKDQEFVLRSWVYSIFFRSLLPTKPILVIFGPPDSFKTETARAILIFLFGSQADVNDPPETTRDLKVIANANHILFLDDFDHANKNLEKHLVRISTGMKAEEREYYTNKGVSITKPNVFVGITAKSPYFSREDFLQRSLIIRLDSTTGNISSDRVKKKILKHRNRIWSDVLENLNKMVFRINRNKSKMPEKVDFRMADWAQFLLSSNRRNDLDVIRKVLSRINKSQIQFLIEANPLASALNKWLRDKNNLGLSISSGKLRKQLNAIAVKEDLDFKTYENNQVFGSEMANVASIFRRRYDVFSEYRRGRTYYSFDKKK